MIKLSGLEDSGITDRLTGRKIYVTVTARKKVRAANPGWAKVRNVLLNTAIANDFSRAKPQTKLFKVRSDPNSAGQVREGSGGEYIAIIDSSSVKIITMGRAGVPKLTGAPAPAQQPFGKQTPAPVALSGSDFEFYITKHALDGLSERLALSPSKLNEVVDLLSERTGMSPSEIARHLESEIDGELIGELSLMCGDGQAEYLQTTEDKNSFVAEPLYEMQSDMPSGAFAVPVALSQR